MPFLEVGPELLNRLLGLIPPQVTALIPPGILGLLGSQNMRMALLLLVAAGVIFVLPIRRTNKAKADEKDVKRPANTPLWQRIWWRWHPPVDMMRVDGLVLDRGRKPHCAWLGPTGAGKSASVATVRLDGARPTLAVTPDTSDPIRAKADFIWTACESVDNPINFLIGEPTEVAERLTEVFRSGGQGVWKRIARRATAQVIRDIDEQGNPRTLKLIGSMLSDAVRSDRELKTACAGWVERFLDLADQFGDSIGPDGVDLVDLLRHEPPLIIVLDNDAFEHPGLVEDIVALGLAEAKRCARRLPKGFRLVFEEAGQLGDRIELAAPFFRAGRRRRITVDVLTQAESDLQYHGNDAITSNIATRVYFAQDLKSLQKTAADRLGLDHQELDPATMRDFSAWVSHGRIRRLIRFPKPQDRHKSATDTVHWGIADIEERTGYDASGISERPIGAIELQRAKLPMLPPPGREYMELLKNVYREGECERWAGKHDRAGHVQGCAQGCQKRHQHRVGCPVDCAIQEHVDNCYGLVWWPLDEPTEKRTHDWQRVHRVRWKLAYGKIGIDENGKPLTIDHRRTCKKDCSRLEHLNGPVTGGENSKRRWRVLGISGKPNGRYVA
jgi:hypothetical protein